MKAPPFAYARASTLDEVFDLLERHGEDARILAGGQSLIPALNMRLAQPAVLIDINRLRDLASISVEGDTVRIGALARHCGVERSDVVGRHLPLVYRAMPFVAHPAIRSRGTFGGSVAFADPAAELPACAVALDATFVLASRAGTRRVAARRFFTNLYETDLRPGEVLVAGEFPLPKPDARSAFLELARRHGDYAIVGVAAHCRLREGRYSDVSLTYFGAGATPLQADHAAAAIEGSAFGGDAVAAAQAALAEDLAPLGDLYHSAGTKLHLARVLTARALGELAG